MNTPRPYHRPRVDWLALAVWLCIVIGGTAFLLVLCTLLTGLVMHLTGAL